MYAYNLLKNQIEVEIYEKIYNSDVSSYVK